MVLQLYNTLTRKKEEFKPIDPSNVRMYVCGPTVYDFAHIGNARPVVVFDVLFRLLRHIYGESHVSYARNITDVDDKINAKGQEEVKNSGGDMNAAIRAITQKFEMHYNADMAALGALQPTFTPHATDYIPHMIQIIQQLIQRGHAYEAENHVLFSVPSMPDYGKLSGRNREEMIAGARVDVAPYKVDPADFVLWKPSDANLPGWDSPWGRGRPGWHIECSAMSRAVLGEHIDIHGGGLDLIFPHHENEVAQSECSCQDPAPFARYWMHNGYLTVDGEKMSKSLGNFFTVRDLLSKANGETMRLALISAHYRQPFDWNEMGLAQSKSALDKFYQAIASAESVPANARPSMPVLEALEDDLNTPKAISELHMLASEINSASSPSVKARLAAQLKADGAVLGILQQSPQSWFQGGVDQGDSSEIEALIAERAQAKKDKNFARADEIRKNLDARGIILEDSPTGTSWKKK